MKKMQEADKHVVGVYKKGVNKKLSKNFSSKEFDCKCSYEQCKQTFIDLDHVEALQKLRDKLGVSVKITSAYRCPMHNKDIGGSPRSQHKKGTATDIQIKEGTAKVEETLMVLERMGQVFKGKGLYDTFTHIDSRTGPLARWDYRRNK